MQMNIWRIIYLNCREGYDLWLIDIWKNIDWKTSFTDGPVFRDVVDYWQ